MDACSLIAVGPLLSHPCMGQVEGFIHLTNPCCASYPWPLQTPFIPDRRWGICLARARAQRAASPAQPFPNHTPRALAAPLTLLLSLPSPGHPRIPLQCLAEMSRSCMSSTDPAEVPQPAGVCREAAPLLV